MHTLPHLVATRNGEALATMAKSMGKPISSLILPLAPKIVAHVLMLPTEDGSSVSLDFFAKAAVEGAQNDVGLDMLLSGHRIEIISELVVNLGAEEECRQVMNHLPHLNQIH